MAVKRKVEVDTSGSSEPAPPPEKAAAAPRNATGQFLPAREAAPAKEPDAAPDAKHSLSLRDLLKASEPPKAEGEEPPAAEEANDDPDASPPAEDGDAPTEEEAAGAETPKVTEVGAYLTPEQRKELAARLELSKAERVKDGELQRLQAELTAAQQKTPLTMRQFLTAKGFSSQEELLEAMLLGKNLDDDGIPTAPAKTNDPEVAQLRGELEKMKQERAAERQAIQRQSAEADRTQSVQFLTSMFTPATHPMVCAMKGHGEIFNRYAKLYNGQGDGRPIAQVAAAELEDELRAAYPEIAAALVSKRPPVPAAKEDAPPAAKPKPSVGARGGARSTEVNDDLPMDPTERQLAVKERLGMKLFR